MKINQLKLFSLLLLCLNVFACSADNQHVSEKQTIEKEKQIIEKDKQIIEKNRHAVDYATNYSSSGKPYYHLSYVLNPDNLLKIDHYSFQQFEQNGGQFELTLDKNSFPIPAPHCKSNLILRMPWVRPGTDLSAKYQLYQALLAVHSAQVGSVTVVLELNPYVQITQNGLELTQCNIFFRHANSQYLPHTDSLNTNL